MTKNNVWPRIYGDLDRNERGEIKSQVPAHEMTNVIQTMEEEIHDDENSLKFIKNIDPTGAFDIKKRLEKKRAQLSEVEKGRPILSGKQRDAVYSEYKRLKSLLSEALPTSNEMDGYGSSPDLAYKEAAALTTPAFKVDPELASECNVRLENGLATRAGIQKIYQRLGRLLNERSDIESARRSRKTIRTQADW